jgi:hypothetical protein
MQRSKLFWRLISIRWRRRQKWRADIGHGVRYQRRLPRHLQQIIIRSPALHSWARPGWIGAGWRRRGQSVSRKCAARQSSSKAGHDGDPPTDYLMSPSRLRDIAGAPAQWGAAAARICCAVPCRSRHRCSTHIGARCSPMGLNLKPTLSLVGRDAANQNAAAS